jgi:hypothetical protein
VLVALLAALRAAVELESVIDCVITRERCPPLGRTHAVQVEALAGDYRYSVVNEPGCPRRVSSKSSVAPGRGLVEPNGIEPMTSGLQSQRSPN